MAFTSLHFPFTKQQSIEESNGASVVAVHTRVKNTSCVPHQCLSFTIGINYWHSIIAHIRAKSECRGCVYSWAIGETATQYLQRAVDKSPCNFTIIRPLCLAKRPASGAGSTFHTMCRPFSMFQAHGVHKNPQSSTSPGYGE